MTRTATFAVSGETVSGLPISGSFEIPIGSPAPPPVAQPIGAMGSYPPATPRALIPKGGWWRVSWSAAPLGVSNWIEGDPGGFKVVDPHRYTDEGFQLFGQIKNASPTPVNGHIIGHEPTDYPAFEASIQACIDSAPVGLLGVDNEEASLGMFTIPGDPTSGQRSDVQDQLAAEAYGRYLGSVVKVGHANGIQVTDGGLITDLVKYGCYQDFLDRGDSAGASAFAAVCFDSFMSASQAKSQSTKCRRWLDQIVLAGPDYINFHFYAAANIIPTGAIEAIASWLTRYTKLPALCDELGVRDAIPATATANCQGVVNAGLLLGAWYTKSAALAVGVVNPDGSLTASGQAIAAFVSAH